MQGGLIKKKKKKKKKKLKFYKCNMNEVRVREEAGWKEEKDEKK